MPEYQELGISAPRRDRFLRDAVTLEQRSEAIIEGEVGPLFDERSIAQRERSLAGYVSRAVLDSEIPEFLADQAAVMHSDSPLTSALESAIHRVYAVHPDSAPNLYAFYLLQEAMRSGLDDIRSHDRQLYEQTLLEIPQLAQLAQDMYEATAHVGAKENFEELLARQDVTQDVRERWNTRLATIGESGYTGQAALAGLEEYLVQSHPASETEKARIDVRQTRVYRVMEQRVEQGVYEGAVYPNVFAALGRRLGWGVDRVGRGAGYALIGVGSAIEKASEGVGRVATTIAEGPKERPSEREQHREQEQVPA